MEIAFRKESGYNDGRRFNYLVLTFMDREHDMVATVKLDAAASWVPLWHIIANGGHVAGFSCGRGDGPFVLVSTVGGRIKFLTGLSEVAVPLDAFMPVIRDFLPMLEREANSNLGY